jgi:hypothetical protein
VVVTSKFITTPAVTSRKMEANQEHVETQVMKASSPTINRGATKSCRCPGYSLLLREGS